MEFLRGSKRGRSVSIAVERLGKSSFRMYQMWKWMDQYERAHSISNSNSESFYAR